MWKSSAVALGLALVVTACGGGPTAPSSTVDFQGIWQGNWQKASCTDTVQNQACSATPQSGVIRLTLTQSGTSVQGTVEVDSLLIPASGSVSANGALSLAGSAHVQANAPGTFTLSNWSTTRSSNSTTGGFTLTFVADNPAFGTQTLQLTLQNVVKTS
jgi:hypothetical protein